jgi:glycosyltransferase involved in cell wall biosynthesis
VANKPRETNVSSLPITVVIPVWHDDRNLQRCLAHVAARFATVLVVDSERTPSTERLARDADAEYLVFSWNGGFPKKRNWVLATYRFSTPWVLFLDADEYVSDAFVEELATELPQSQHDGYWITYTNHFMGHLLRFGPPMRKLALFRVGTGSYERIEEASWSSLDMEVHEHPVLRGSTGSLKTPLEHNDYNGLHAYLARHNDYSSWEAKRYLALTATPDAWASFTPTQRRKYSSLTRWWLAPAYFAYSYLWKRGFLDGGPGLAFALLKAVYFFHIRLKIQELQARSSRAAETTHHDHGRR